MLNNLAKIDLSYNKNSSIDSLISKINTKDYLLNNNPKPLKTIDLSINRINNIETLKEILDENTNIKKDLEEIKNLLIESSNRNRNNKIYVNFNDKNNIIEKYKIYQSESEDYEEKIKLLQINDANELISLKINENIIENNSENNMINENNDIFNNIQNPILFPL